MGDIVLPNFQSPVQFVEDFESDLAKVTQSLISISLDPDT